jgi:hypothetical protein
MQSWIHGCKRQLRTSDDKIAASKKWLQFSPLSVPAAHGQAGIIFAHAVSV